LRRLTTQSHSLLTIAATTPGSPFEKHNPDDLVFQDGRVFVKADGPAKVRRSQICSGAPTSAWSQAVVSPMRQSVIQAEVIDALVRLHFVEVTWQPEIARLRVSRVVTVIDAGRILNPLAGRNQIQGAVVMGIGMALFEHTSYDPQSGAPINSNLADYVMTVNADAPPIDVHFLDFPDKEINQLGARGIGEIGLTASPPRSPRRSTTQPVFACGNCR